jgi:hypothetical protein
VVGYVFLEAVGWYIFRANQEAVDPERLILPLGGVNATHDSRRAQAVRFPKFLEPIVAGDVFHWDHLAREVTVVVVRVRPENMGIGPGRTLLDYTIGGKHRNRVAEELLCWRKILFHGFRRKTTTHSRFTPR